MTLGTRPDKFLGDKKLWDKAEKILQEILKKKKIPFKVAEKDGAFYGPKIDLRIKDALNREWQLATVQLDFQLPLRFELSYEGKDSKKHTPIMIHRAILGSIERFMALLIEHYAGKFPLWLNPIQVIIMNINEKNLKFAEEVFEKLKQNDIRTELDDRNESIPKKVRESQLRKIPYSITIGDKEQSNKTLAIRTLDGNVKFNVKVDDFIKEINDKIKNKR